MASALEQEEEAKVQPAVESVLKESPYNHLKPIILHRKDYANKDKTLYRVYTSEAEFQVIEAGSAHEAYTLSGISRAHRIIRESLDRKLAVSQEQIVASEESVEVDPNLPELGEEQFGFDPDMEAFAEEYYKGKPFEEMEISDLGKGQDEPEDEEVVEEPEPAPEPEMAAAPEPEPDPEPVVEPKAEPEEEIAAPVIEPVEKAEEPEDAGELSEEEVQALLNQD